MREAATEQLAGDNRLIEAPLVGTFGFAAFCAVGGHVAKPGRIGCITYQARSKLSGDGG
jgi:hypothetical protein